MVCLGTPPPKCVLVLLAMCIYVALAVQYQPEAKALNTAALLGSNACATGASNSETALKQGLPCWGTRRVGRVGQGISRR